MLAPARLTAVLKELELQRVSKKIHQKRTEVPTVALHVKPDKMPELERETFTA